MSDIKDKYKKLLSDKKDGLKKIPSTKKTNTYIDNMNTDKTVIDEMFDQQLNVIDKSRKAKLVGNKIILNFDYDSQLVSCIKTLDGRKYVAKDKNWTCPVSLFNINGLIRLNFDLDRDLIVKTERLYNLMQKKTAKTKAYDTSKIKVPKGLELMNFQLDGVGFLESRKGNAIIGDEMGTGKTITVLTYISNNPKIKPVIIIVPASIKYNWKQEADKWLLNKRDIQILEGKTTKKLRKTSDIIIINYDIMWAWAKELCAIKPKLVVLDECHAIKNSKAKRTKAVKRVSKVARHVIPLSGTPAINRPAELFNSIQLVEPTLFSSYKSFAQQYCDPQFNGFGWEYKGASNLKELYNILSNIMIRRKKEDVIMDLPEKRRSFIPIELDNVKDYQKAENDFIEWIKENKGKKAAMRAMAAETLVRIATLRLLAVKGALKNSIQWINSFLEDYDGKLVIFAVHKEIINTLMEEYGEIAVKIDGSISTKGDTRQKIVEEFQNNDNIRIFIGNIKAAGVGITLTASSNVAFLELPWTPGELTQAEDRCHRINQKNAVNIWYLLAENTIEMELAKTIDTKRNVLSQVLDGEIIEQDDTLSSLLGLYESRGK